MVAVKQKIPHREDGSIDIDVWVSGVTSKYALKNPSLLIDACHTAEHAIKGLTTFYGQPSLEQGLEMAEIILSLKLDETPAAAAILTSTLEHTTTPIDDITQKMGDDIAKLVSGVAQMNVINSLAKSKMRDHTQTDRLRKTFLSMVSDIRVVIIKLAERTVLMRNIKNINLTTRKRLAQETMDIYAPLANRLGIGQIKWELEDFAFHYMDPDTYKTIAKFLAERRVDRENVIHQTIQQLSEELKKSNISASLSGRAKHIYSIYLKQQRKDLDYKNIYDYSAVRILVEEIPDCYQALSIVHQLWEHIPAEFDDYISHPKNNGYRSIHTAVIGPHNRNMEIQIRTRAMHEEAEHGLAAHWVYKENKTPTSGYDNKITFLRQLLEWHKDVTKASTPAMAELEDRVYVFTPAGDILDLPKGSTPLDFAYQIHSNLGHRCRGAKINSHIVPLSYQLQTGDRVELITVKEGHPSRDWLSKDTGYIFTARARAKIAQWFRHQEVAQYYETGKHQFEREIQRAGLHSVNIQKIATHFHYKTDEAFFTAIGHGMVRLAHVIQALLAGQNASTPAPAHISTHKKSPELSSRLHIKGVDGLLTRIAKCCKPIPGDPIIGFITQGRGVSIHRQNCQNVGREGVHQGRFLEISWSDEHTGSYFVDLQIRAQAAPDLLKEITANLSELKMELISLNSTISKNNALMYITLTIQINKLTELQKLTSHLKQIPRILDVKRVRE